jgi:enamine deaminase RidA (YjgF/YER057c/UK114 family)
MRCEKMIKDTLKKLLVVIPDIPKPTAAYVPARIIGNLIYASGQTPTQGDNLIFAGRVGKDLTVEKGYQAARLACINCLAELQVALGDLDKIARIIKVNGYVRSAEGFGDQPKVINGASELLEAIFGEAGKHARTSLGVSELPDGAAVVIELIAEVRK